MFVLNKNRSVFRVINRLQYLTYSTLSILIYIGVFYLFLVSFPDFSAENRQFLNSVGYFILCSMLFFIAILRLKDIGKSKYWATILFFPWFFSMENMFLFFEFVQNSNKIPSLAIYLSIAISAISLIFMAFLLLKKGKNEVNVG